jgi:hypothetical protein
MADRTCTRCGRAFKFPAHLRDHLRRKTPCAPILEREDLPPEALEDPDLEKKKCRFCGRVFSSYTSMRRHVRETCKIAPNAKNGDTGMDILYEHTIRRQQAQIDDLRRQNEEMMGMMRQLVARDGAVVSAAAGRADTTAVAIQGDNNVNIVDARRVEVVVNVFGSEGLEHVTRGRIRAILEESLGVGGIAGAAQAAVLKTALLVYSDPEHPENLTCYLPNKKGDEALVHMSRNGTTGWEVQPVPLVLPPMARKSVDALFDRQPFEDAGTFEPLMAELRDNEERYVAGQGALRPVLVRNKDLLARALASLPVSGAP